MVAWDRVQTVFLDMDGTLLDLHYDNHFWLEFVPLRYAEANNLPLEDSKNRIFSLYQKVQGTLDWYCVDYWSERLGLDIPMLKQEVDHLIAVHPHVVDFLDAVRACNKRIVLVTNAHGKSISIKMQRTQLGGHFDAMVCAHDIGLPKEHHDFWQMLQKKEPFDNNNTLFIDDSLPVLRSARQYGITQLLAVRGPDSRKPENKIDEFEAISSFKEIIPKIS